MTTGKYYPLHGTKGKDKNPFECLQSEEKKQEFSCKIGLDRNHESKKKRKTSTAFTV